MAVVRPERRQLAPPRSCSRNTFLHSHQGRPLTQITMWHDRGPHHPTPIRINRRSHHAHAQAERATVLTMERITVHSQFVTRIRIASWEK